MRFAPGHKDGCSKRCSLIKPEAGVSPFEMDNRRQTHEIMAVLNFSKKTKSLL
jgi:hypothetical protein